MADFEFGASAIARWGHRLLGVLLIPLAIIIVVPVMTYVLLFDPEIGVLKRRPR